MLTHGDFEIRTEGNVIIAKLSGSFNEIGAKALTYGLMKVVEAQGTRGFVELIDGIELNGFNPEGYQVLNDYNAWLNSKNLVAKALVYKSSIIPMINDKLIKSQIEQNVKVFSDTKPAMEWLLRELAK